jgi:hypothetical protein
MRSVVDRNVVIRSMAVLKSRKLKAVCPISNYISKGVVTLATFLVFLPTADTRHIEMHRTISNGLEDTPFDRDSDC